MIFNRSDSLSSGGRNLLLLGFGSALIAVITVWISLYFYHSSGDIYLDRSRPGFLPDKAEEKTLDSNSKFTFSDQGAVNATAIDEYLEKIKSNTSILDQLKDSFDTKPLSDSSLGISDQTTPQ